MSRAVVTWRDSVTELHNRLDRCENYLKTDLAVNDRLEEVDIDMADTKEGKTHVYRQGFWIGLIPYQTLEGV